MPHRNFYNQMREVADTWNVRLENAGCLVRMSLFIAIGVLASLLSDWFLDQLGEHADQGRAAIFLLLLLILVFAPLNNKRRTRK